MEINPVKGTHDIYQKDGEVYYTIEVVARYLSQLYNFREFRMPIMEHTPLFLRSVGESSDIVNKEMYTFEDKGGRSVTLRPEMTAGVMRSIVSNKLYVNADLPMKYFYDGPCFRYERPQAGRYRQFYQVGVESVGVTSPFQDAEVIKLGMDILNSLQIKNVKLLINTLGDQESRDNYRKALKECFAQYIDNMCSDCKRRFEINPLRILDCKDPDDRKYIEGAPKMKDFLSEGAKQNFKKVLNALESVGITPEIDDTLVRGLDYYSGVVFEYHLNEDDDVGAIGGGGHYNNLLKEIGGPDLEGVGLSFGLERLVHVFKKYHDVENEVNFFIDAYVMSMNENAFPLAYSLMDTLRDQGLAIEGNYETKSFKSLFKVAVKKNAKLALIIGDDEIANGTITVKNLKTQEQSNVKVDDLLGVIQTMLDESSQDDSQGEN